MRRPNLVVVAVPHVAVPQMCHRASAQGWGSADHEGGSEPPTCTNTGLHRRARTGDLRNQKRDVPKCAIWALLRDGSVGPESRS
jgi:hypothetical protein